MVERWGSLLLQLVFLVLFLCYGAVLLMFVCCYAILLLFVILRYVCICMIIYLCPLSGLLWCAKLHCTSHTHTPTYTHTHTHFHPAGL